MALLLASQSNFGYHRPRIVAATLLWVIACHLIIINATRPTSFQPKELLFETPCNEVTPETFLSLSLSFSLNIANCLERATSDEFAQRFRLSLFHSFNHGSMGVTQLIMKRAVLFRENNALICIQMFFERCNGWKFSPTRNKDVLEIGFAIMRNFDWISFVPCPFITFTSYTFNEGIDMAKHSQGKRWETRMSRV